MIDRTRAALATSAACLLACVAATAAPDRPPASTSPEFPAYVMQRIDDMYRGARSHGVMEMQVQTRHWSRSLSLESWSLGREFSLVRILSPKKEQGTATLRARQDLFTYLSNTGRTIKITSAMMGGSWMGSHFTNDDLVQVSRYSEHYDIKLAFEGEEKGAKVYRFTLAPRPKAPVVWGRVEITVEQASLLPLREVFFDEDGKAVREMEMSDLRSFGGRRLPSRMVMRPLDGSGESTSIAWSKLEFDVALDEGFFSLQRLRAM